MGGHVPQGIGLTHPVVGAYCMAAVPGFSTICCAHNSSKGFPCYDEGRKSYNGVYDSRPTFSATGGIGSGSSWE